MRDNPVKGMYLRPGRLYQKCRILRKKTELSESGLPYFHYEDTGETFRAIFSVASSTESDKYRHLWDQDQHSLTHTCVSRGEAVCKKGDAIAANGTTYFVLLVDNAGGIYRSTIYYLEERNDLK